MNPKESGRTEGPKDQRFSPPAVSLPKGGGAIRGIGEKFAANPVTGTGSMSVPIAVSPGRSGFGPQLSLSYDSGAGNGLFGLGWSLSLPAITRKTDKGLPQYRDEQKSNVTAFSCGATVHASKDCSHGSSDGRARATGIPIGARFPGKTSRPSMERLPKAALPTRMMRLAYSVG